MSVLQKILAKYMTRRLREVDAFRRNPAPVQDRQLQYLLTKGKKTEYGKAHNFSSIKDYADFAKQVPLTEYADLQPWIERSVTGASDVLWPGRMRWMAKSSGTTTGRSKYIPVSQEALQHCHYRAGRDMLGHYCRSNPKAQIFSGKGIILGGSHERSPLRNDLSVGDLSGLLVQNLSPLARYLSSIDLSVALTPNWEEKLEALAKQYLPLRVSNISGVSSWMLVLLQYLVKKEGKEHILEIWPDFEVCFHGGVNFEPYKNQFDQLFPGDQVRYFQTYNASEGFFAMQEEAKSEDMLLMLDYGIFYEFLEVGTDSAIPLEEVELGKRYALVISTSSGLWRYQPGDIVEFANLSPFRIRITGRTSQFINAFGEELIADNVERALGVACKEAEVSLSDFTVAPIYIGAEKRGQHEWLVEFEQAPKDVEAFTRLLDECLQGTNSDYAAKRKGDLLLKGPLLSIAPKGLFYKWLASKGKLGGQNKVPRLQNDRQLLDEIKALI